MDVHKRVPIDRHAEQCGHGALREVRTATVLFELAIGVGRIDAIAAVIWDYDEAVARNRNHGRGVFIEIDRNKKHGVGPARVASRDGLIRSLVDPHQEDGYPARGRARLWRWLERSRSSCGKWRRLLTRVASQRRLCGLRRWSRSG